MKVYVATNGQASKIGISWEPQDRMRTLRHKGTPADLCRVFAPERADLVEKLAHELLMDKRAQGEWFNVTPEQACAAVEEAIERVANGWSPAPRQTRNRKAEQAYEASGKRPGTSISVRLSVDELAALDAARGATARAAWIKALIKKQLGSNG